jgi:hypothetical protein
MAWMLSDGNPQTKHRLSPHDAVVVGRTATFRHHCEKSYDINRIEASGAATQVK